MIINLVAKDEKKFVTDRKKTLHDQGRQIFLVGLFVIGLIQQVVWYPPKLNCQLPHVYRVLMNAVWAVKSSECIRSF